MKINYNSSKCMNHTSDNKGYLYTMCFPHAVTKLSPTRGGTGGGQVTSPPLESQPQLGSMGMSQEDRSLLQKVWDKGEKFEPGDCRVWVVIELLIEFNWCYIYFELVGFCSNLCGYFSKFTTSLWKIFRMNYRIMVSFSEGKTSLW